MMIDPISFLSHEVVAEIKKLEVQRDAWKAKHDELQTFYQCVIPGLEQQAYTQGYIHSCGDHDVHYVKGLHMKSFDLWQDTRKSISQKSLVKTPPVRCYSDHNEDIRVKGSCDYCRGTELDPPISKAEVVEQSSANLHTDRILQDLRSRVQAAEDILESIGHLSVGWLPALETWKDIKSRVHDYQNKYEKLKEV